MSKKVLIALVVLASLAIAPTTAAAPASAEVPCNDSAGWLGPYWFGSVQASNIRGHQMLLTPASPKAYANGVIWTNMGMDTQWFWSDCVGYSDLHQRYIYIFRLVNDSRLCLDTGATRGQMVRMNWCSEADSHYQRFEQVDTGVQWTPDGYLPTSAFFNNAWQTCLDEWAPNDGDGVIMSDCKYNDQSQLWYWVG